MTSKKFYGLTKCIISSSTDSAIPPLIADNGDVIVDDYENNHFNKFCTQSSVVDDTSASIPSLIAEPIPTLSDIVVQEEEVWDQIKILDCSKSYGPHGISPRFIKMAGVSLVKPLTLLLNISLSNGIFPSNWKKANVLPLHKKNPQNNMLITIGQFLFFVVWARYLRESYSKMFIIILGRILLLVDGNLAFCKDFQL